MDGFRVFCSNRLDRLIDSTEIKGYKHTYYADCVLMRIVFGGWVPSPSLEWSSPSQVCNSVRHTRQEAMPAINAACLLCKPPSQPDKLIASC